MAEVIHVKDNHEGQIRITLAEPHGLVQAHRKVVAKVPGNAYDHAGVRFDPDPTVEGGGVSRKYQSGDPCEDVVIHLAGQREFLVPAGTSRLEFDDGSSFDLPGASSPASASSPAPAPAPVPASV